MNPEDDIELGQALERHFADRLDAQLGRATKAFTDHQVHSHRRSRFIGITVAGLVAATAAAIVLAILPHPRPAHDAPAPVAQANVGTLEQVVWSRTIDAGTVLLDGQTPARKLVREQIREVHWTDPAGGRHIRSSTPRRDVLLISLDTY